MVRAFVQHGMHKLPLPVKLWYLAPMFRYEAPQSGRYREHWQFGAEAIGSDDPLLDAEVIALLDGILRRLEVPGLRLRVGSMGDAESRGPYRELLVGVPRGAPRGPRRGRPRPHAREPAAPVRQQGPARGGGHARGADPARPPLAGGRRAPAARARGPRPARDRLRGGPVPGARVRLLHDDGLRVHQRPPRRPERRRRRGPLRRPGRGPRRAAHARRRLRGRRRAHRAGDPGRGGGGARVARLLPGGARRRRCAPRGWPCWSGCARRACAARATCAGAA